MLNVSVFFDEESIKKLIYDSLWKELPKIEGEICNYDIKQIIFDMTKKIISYDIEWADPAKFGKNKMLIFHKNKVLQLDTTELIESIRVVHQDYVEPQV